MNFASDKRLQELNQLIQMEADPQKLVQLADEFTRRLKQLQDSDRPNPSNSSSPTATS
jgi:hypothetical protein